MGRALTSARRLAGFCGSSPVEWPREPVLHGRSAGRRALHGGDQESAAVGVWFDSGSVLQDRGRKHDSGFCTPATGACLQVVVSVVLHLRRTESFAGRWVCTFFAIRDLLATVGNLPHRASIVVDEGFHIWFMNSIQGQPTTPDHSTRGREDSFLVLFCSLVHS